MLSAEYDIPAFDGHSFVQLKRLKAYNKLSIEIEFKTYANDGILLYNQQKSDGTGDFVSLAIVNGWVHTTHTAAAAQRQFCSQMREWEK